MLNGCFFLNHSARLDYYIACFTRPWSAFGRKIGRASVHYVPQSLISWLYHSAVFLRSGQCDQLVCISFSNLGFDEFFENYFKSTNDVTHGVSVENDSIFFFRKWWSSRAVGHFRSWHMSKVSNKPATSEPCGKFHKRSRDLGTDVAGEVARPRISGKVTTSLFK